MRKKVVLGNIPRIVLGFILTFYFSQVQAAVPKDNTPIVKTFLSEGTFRGGVAGIGFSILSVKRVHSSDGTKERIILEYGDKEGHAYKGKVGYFHGQLFRNPSELSLDLSQLLRTKVTTESLRTITKKSNLIRKVTIDPDVNDNSTNLNFGFSKPVKVRMFTRTPKDANPKLVIDITKI